MSAAGFLFSIWVKFFFLFTPFFALSMFLSLATGYSPATRRKLVAQVCLAVGILCFALFFFGNIVFSLLGITLDAFRIGAGALLFLSAVSLVQGRNVATEVGPDEDIAVVPMAMPVIVGPATVGTLLVLGAEVTETAQRGLGCLALILAILCMGAVLLLGSSIERAVGKRGIHIMSKVTGLILAALAAQMILTGLDHYLHKEGGPPPSPVHAEQGESTP
jgi:multiple antibiotic resistance protein